MSTAQTTADHLGRFNVAIKRSFVICIALLAPLTAVKIDELQTIEIYTLIAFGVVGAAIWHDRLRIRGEHEVLRLLKFYALFLIIAASLAFWALRFPTYPIPGTPLIKHAPFLSLARLAQYTIVIGTLLITASLVAARPSLGALLCQCYVYGGIVSCIFGVISWAGLFAGIHLGGAYGPTHRIRGFFVEGGPFGVYLVGVILVCIFRRHVLHRGDRRAYWAQMVLLVGTLFGAQSKAGILLAIIIALYYMVLTKRLRYVLAFAPIFLALAVFVHLTSQLRSYGEDYLNFSKLAQEHPNDPALIEGRVMAAILVPIMVAHHPIAGIGIGNYSLQRNNPEYLGPLPATSSWDLPGLGLLGDSAELGIPLLIYLCWLLWRPVSIAHRVRAPPLVALTAAYQIFAHMLGVQVTFAYPWIVSAIALGYSLTLRNSHASASAGALRGRRVTISSRPHAALSFRQ